jgi:hypothetical protein
MDGVRISALVLYALADADRKWLLARLPALQRDRLSELLRELRSSGMEADYELVQRLIREKQALSTVSDRLVPSKQLVHADARALWQVLKGEPDTLIARLLGLHAWPWQDEIFAIAGIERAARIERLLGKVHTAPVLDLALVEQIETRLAQTRPMMAGTGLSRWRLRRKGER